MSVKHSYVRVPLFEQIQIIDGLTEEEAWNKEIELIKLYGREDLGTGTLNNLTHGGPTQKSGWSQSEQAREKISRGNKGKIRTEEQRKNYKGCTTASWAEKIRAANIGRKDDGRYSKMAKTKSKQRWFNNGKVTRMFEPGKELEGFVPGRTIGNSNVWMA